MFTQSCDLCDPATWMVKRKNTRTHSPRLPPQPPSPYHPGRTFNNRKSTGAAKSAVLSHTLTHNHQLPIIPMKRMLWLDSKGPHTLNIFSASLNSRTFYLLITPLDDARELIGWHKQTYTHTYSDCCSVYYTSRRVECASATLEARPFISPTYRGAIRAMPTESTPSRSACFAPHRGLALQNVYVLC